MSRHLCTIGMLYDDDYDLVTLNGLKSHIANTEYDNNIMTNMFNGNPPKSLLRTKYELKDYADRRKSTDFKRFEYCPHCGKKIDWKKIKNGEVQQ